MANAAVRIERLKCVDPNDSLTDEVKLQQDGRQVWPNTGDGYFSLSKGNEVAMNLVLTFDNATRIALFDDEDIGADDRLGSILVSRTEEGGVRSQDVVAAGSRYTVTYRVKSLFF